MLKINLVDGNLVLREIRKLEGHTDRVSSLAWNPTVGAGGLPPTLASCSGLPEFGNRALQVPGLYGLVDEEGSLITILGDNFMAGFVAGSLAATAICLFDVAKTRRQIEKDPPRLQRSNTWRTLSDVWSYMEECGSYHNSKLEACELTICCKKIFNPFQLL